jgi:hypothetical protein
VVLWWWWLHWIVKTWNPAKNSNETEVNFGAQGVIGLDYKFANIPLNLSLDWKPELNLVSDINFEPAAVGLTVRFTFKFAGEGIAIIQRIYSTGG